MSWLPEIVGYRGNCFQIFNPHGKERNSRGQASFPILDLFVSDVPYVA